MWIRFIKCHCQCIPFQIDSLNFVFGLFDTADLLTAFIISVCYCYPCARWRDNFGYVVCSGVLLPGWALHDFYNLGLGSLQASMINQYRRTEIPKRRRGRVLQEGKLFCRKLWKTSVIILFPVLTSSVPPVKVFPSFFFWAATALVGRPQRARPQVWG